MHSLVARRLEMGKHAKDDLFSFVIDEKDPETGDGMTEMELFVESEIYLIADQYKPVFANPELRLTH